MRLFWSLVVVAVSAGVATSDDWPQWLGPKRDGVWRETGLVDKFPAGGPKRLWKEAIGIGYARPAGAGGKIVRTQYLTGGKTKVPRSGVKARRVSRPQRLNLPRART